MNTSLNELLYTPEHIGDKRSPKEPEHVIRKIIASLVHHTDREESRQKSNAFKKVLFPSTLPKKKKRYY